MCQPVRQNFPERQPMGSPKRQNTVHTQGTSKAGHYPPPHHPPQKMKALLFDFFMKVAIIQKIGILMDMFNIYFIYGQRTLNLVSA